jgi:hypothetical protein
LLCAPAGCAAVRLLFLMLLWAAPATGRFKNAADRLTPGFGP